MMPNVDPSIPNPPPSPNDSYEIFGYKIAKNKAWVGLGVLILAGAYLLYSRPSNKGIIISSAAGLTQGPVTQTQNLANAIFNNNR